MQAPEYIEFEELSSLVKRALDDMTEQKNPLFLFYEKHLKNSAVFSRDIYKIISRDGFLGRYHTPDPEPTLYDILLYVYFMPLVEKESIPHFNAYDWEKWFTVKKKSRKEYYSNVVKKEGGDNYSGALNISEFVRENIETLNITNENPKTEQQLIKETIDNIIIWGAPTSNDTLYGKALVAFPMVSALSPLKKKSLFLIDLGLELYCLLQTYVVDEPPLIIPKNILKRRFIGIRKGNVEPEVEYDAKAESIELRSGKYNTIYGVISLASELSSIANEEEKKEKVTAIKEENRLFANITAKDFSALSNILRLFFHKDSPTVVESNLGELCSISLSGLVSEREIAAHKKRYMLDTLEILHKWSSYTFDLGSAGGRFNVINYVSGSYTNPSALADAIRDGKIKGDFLLEKKSDERVLIGDTPNYSDMNAAEIGKIPVKLEISALFKQSIEHDQMTKQFAYYYEQLKNPNAQMIYAFIDDKREEKGYPDTLYVSYNDFKESFVADMRKKQFLKLISDTLTELQEIGAIKSFEFSDVSASYRIYF